MSRVLLHFARHLVTPSTKSAFTPGGCRTLLTSFMRSKAVAAVVHPVDRYQTVGKWLLGLSGMTFGAVVLGGATRLTESGLSMVDWHPFKEAPPLTEEQWLQEFDKYKQFPEYQYQVNQHGEMSLSQFKFIWYMEYSHRMWGRLIGAVFAIPGAYFWYKGYFTRRMKPRVLIYGGLLGLQGLLGWLMVRSGLKEPQPPVGHKPGEPFAGVPRVNHFWLCAHLSSAAILFSLFLWGSFDYLAHHQPVKPFGSLKLAKILGHSTKALIFATLIFGAFVAGLDAGLVYNTWPKMADRWVPDDLITPQYGSTFGNLLNNPTGVQFSHRILAYTTVACATALWATVMRTGLATTGPRIRTAAHLVLAAAVGQSTLGVMTLLYYVPVWLGVMHQGGSLVLLSSALWFTHCLRAVPK
ncbi:Cytochrome c oxidase assembly protein cox15 [Clonorchis sinensis]|uniref:Cytochrome c oxidase assembly protein cox15 n=1 Tax=Clonorchis sinensis TaxID=79923 RepID=A0A8T1M556_CLOSI|nr:Cytochrome c oxidase assembly protein cox15 [Clonorchis sinensis]